ncbi:MAG: enoyl-CoA hydratase/isomerase family protein [Proteobacteria bacterium]|nr:enoyl-CoA hydratase/isomerase family protein [Pseudomonadota bacterium]
MDELEIVQSDHTVEVRLDRPAKANALSACVVEGLLDLLDECERRRVRLLIFSGNGAHFCAGFDLGGLQAQTDGDLLWRLIRIEMLLQRIHHAPFLTMALAHGTVVGAGTDLVCVCALRIAAPGTSFRMPGWRFGVALGTRRLVARIGTSAARSVLLEGRRFDAEEALRIGFVDRIAPGESWREEIRKAQRAACALDSEATASLLCTSVADTRSEDMASLVSTAGRPGLKSRLLAYQEAARRRTGLAKPEVLSTADPKPANLVKQ